MCTCGMSERKRERERGRGRETLTTSSSGGASWRSLKPTTLFAAATSLRR